MMSVIEIIFIFFEYYLVLPVALLLNYYTFKEKIEHRQLRIKWRLQEQEILDSGKTVDIISLLLKRKSTSIRIIKLELRKKNYFFTYVKVHKCLNQILVNLKHIKLLIEKVDVNKGKSETKIILDKFWELNRFSIRKEVFLFMDRNELIFLNKSNSHIGQWSFVSTLKWFYFRWLEKRILEIEREEVMIRQCYTKLEESLKTDSELKSKRDSDILNRMQQYVNYSNTRKSSFSLNNSTRGFENIERKEAQIRQSEVTSKRDFHFDHAKEQNILNDSEYIEVIEKDGTINVINVGTRSHTLRWIESMEKIIKRKSGQLRLRNSISKFVNYYYIFDYIPNNKLYLVHDDLELFSKVRKSIFEFKNGRQNNLLNLKIAEAINALNLQILGNPDWYVCAIPASSVSASNVRFKSFIGSMSHLLKIKDGFQYIQRQYDIEASISDGKKRDIDVLEGINFRSELIGKKVLLFDDVITKGTSLRYFSTHLLQFGVLEVVPVFIGRTFFSKHLNERPSTTINRSWLHGIQK